MGCIVTQLLRPPSYADPERSRQARLLHVSVLGFFGITSTALLLILVLQPEYRQLAAHSLLRTSLLCAGAFWLNRAGRQRMAAAVLVLGLIVIITLNATKVGGLRSPGVQFYFVFAMLAALLLGETAGVLTGALCVVLMLGLVIAEARHVITPAPVGYSIWVLWTLYAMYLVIFLFSLLFGMRRLRQANEELEQHRRSLADLVECRTEELRRARDAADRANRAKTVFLANVSHEIRTPMNAVLGFTQLLLRDPSMNPGQRGNLETIVRAGDHLMVLIDEILQLAKVESGHDALAEAPFDVWALVDDIEALFQPRALDKHLRLAVERAADVPRYVRADHGKLRQVLSNLVGNAIKFTAQGSVTLRIRSAQTAAELRLCIEVEDTGPGIAAAEMSRLFRKFEQTETGRASKQGTGLGLAICRELVESMGGKIHATSTRGRGSVFEFQVPVTEALATDVTQTSVLSRPLRLEPGSATYRVLVVDDHDDNRAPLARMLGLAGFETRECVNGAQALADFRSWQPHLILMDLRMPTLDGVQATREIRRAPGGERVKIVCVSASAYDDDVRIAREAGADGFLKKPIRDSQLLDQIGELLGARYERAAREVSAATDSALTAAAVSQIPEPIRRALRDATRSADLDSMLSLLDQAAAYELRGARALRELAERFAYERVAELLEEVGPVVQGNGR